MADPLWTSADIARATGGAEGGGGFSATGVSIDTRSLEPGDLFVALAGVRDGHEFIAQAMAKGAAGALVSQDADAPFVKATGDVLAALEKLGVAARDRAVQAKRGAVTGSVGKTSVTQAIMAGLSLAGPAHSSIKSYNNHIGVPLTLARMPADTERAVFEIGMNHADEIRPLTKFVRPHAVVVTTVGPVHTENFPDGEAGVARAKAEIFDGLEPGGVAILNADNRWFDLLKAEAERAGGRVLSFGTGEACDARLIDFQAERGHAVVQARLHGKAMDFPILQTGFHWGSNSMAVLLMLEALDVDLDKSLAALGSFEPLAGRGAESNVALKGGAFTLIDESYNANPISMASAIKTLGARETSGRRIVALTDMLELGPEAQAFHAGLAAPLEAASIDLVFCAGPLMKSLWDALPPTRRGGYAETAAGLAPRLAQAVEAGDVVMVKGSNGSKAGLIAQGLLALGDLATGSGEAG
ncbi:MAG: UDP-N-acetylmuramoyl-tripeptide--D-alanyl-D-alanine ligase [Alphaproteobacteria bacterium]|nr:UDP-N-acetylmuramoyl-tripeptide--D-alanyl-D-alanine ligase [Alphaproteobacteria bacterium]MBU1513051.1 UDP-N-acetylmuramoyl-tripeptide--D-alanyl-D-alanine ligase [Alphaproteobacteria bacterium]MBU2095159.1 UDP-N-acetylmuramoyl-tripeptide--D-alanyl-D-alanine ligase [Alphaproteobacteria bacterium]MBU2152100.1 UDP-N-acetylmuramoyl-tripeptide--D-alanyl-D-alanine ligase [Alphaproteobacteria bacterium]MBU2306410.1 UDP-N-acetylmuramoyl-tripeptide--D-alanyl-D-alanine ligase [Alphaproteobacteria bact